MKITAEKAYTLMKIPTRELAKKRGFGRKTIEALCEEYRLIILAKCEARREEEL